SCPPALPFSRTAPHVFSLLSLVPLNPTPHPIFPTPSLLPILSPMPPPPRNDGSRDSDTSPAFHLPQLVFSPVDLEEPPFARHRGRAAATTRGLPLAGAPSFSTTRHQQRRMTPPSTPSHDVQPLTPPETLARIGQRCSSTGSPPKVASSSSSGSSSSPDLMRVRVLVAVCRQLRQLKEGAGHGEATRAASSVHTHHRSSEGASLLGLANYADEEEDEHRGPRGRANGRPREEEEEEDERRALERRPRQVELRRDCPYLDTVNRLEAAEASTDWQINDLALQATKSVQRRSWFHFLAYWSDYESRFCYFGSNSIDLVRCIYIDASTLLHKYGYILFAGCFLR
uniref:Uncharacterized protein n=1 Tax=Aegilops tauschii subsp. strangulata TaxID=200361 RepID=A0A452Y926_AEGTS